MRASTQALRLDKGERTLFLLGYCGCCVSMTARVLARAVCCLACAHAHSYVPRTNTHAFTFAHAHGHRCMYHTMGFGGMIMPAAEWMQRVMSQID